MKKFIEHIVDIYNLTKLKIAPATFALINEEYQALDVLKRNGANVFAPEENGNTAIHLASFFGKPEVVKYCIDQGFDVNAKNGDGETALHIAISKENVDLVKMLLENKASKTIENKIHYFPIHEAIETENMEIVNLLIDSLEDVRKIQTEFDAVHLAAKLSSSNMLEFLLRDRKSYVNIIDNKKRQARPIHYAVIGKSTNNVNLLASMGAMMNAQDINGNTPMHLAVLDKEIELVRVLHQNKANAKIKNNDGYSAIDFCFSDLDQVLLRYFRSLAEYRKEFQQL